MKAQTSLVLVVVMGVLLTAIYFVYRSYTHSSCDSIFEQTADRVRGNFEFIKSKGELVLGRDQVQALTEGSQKVALHLKTCCIVQQNRAMNAEQLQSCIGGAKDYEGKFVQISTIIKEAQSARDQGDAQLVEQKTKQARQAASEAVTAFRGIAAAVDDLKGSTPKETARPEPPRRGGGSEQEANNTILEANASEMGASIAGEIAPPNDQDYFKFQYRDAKNRRDVVDVRLDNQSATLRPSIRLHNEDKSVAHDWVSANTAGAEAALVFSAEPGKSYYVVAASVYGQSSGKYALSVVPRKAYDQYEPNGDAFTATPLKFGRTIEANIMDGPDTDWYRLSGIDAKTVTVRLQNKSSTLRPSIRVHNADRSVAQDWTSANTEGADLEVTFAAQPDREYFVVVASVYGRSFGKYDLSTR